MFLSVHIKIFSSCAAITKYQKKWDAKDETELSSIILISNAYAIKQLHVVIAWLIIKYYKYELIKYICSKKKILGSSALYFRDLPNSSFENNISFFKSFKNIQVDQYCTNSASKSRNCLYCNIVFSFLEFMFWLVTDYFQPFPCCLSYFR